MTAYWINNSNGTIFSVFSCVASRTTGQAAPACWTCSQRAAQNAPAIAGTQAREAVLRHRGGKIVAQGFRRFEESVVNDAADGVDAEVVGTGLAAAGAVKASHGIAAAGC